MSPKKTCGSECPVDVVALSERVASNEAKHDEILRRLSDISVSLRDLDSDIRAIMATQANLDKRLTSNENETKRVETRLTTIMGALGTLMIAVVTGGFAVAARFIGK